MRKISRDGETTGFLGGLQGEGLRSRRAQLMEADFCVEAPEAPLGRHGKPKKLNTDQGSRFTGVAFTQGS